MDFYQIMNTNFDRMPTMMIMSWAIITWDMENVSSDTLRGYQALLVFVVLAQVQFDGDYIFQRERVLWSLWTFHENINCVSQHTILRTICCLTAANRFFSSCCKLQAFSWLWDVNAHEMAVICLTFEICERTFLRINAHERRLDVKQTANLRVRWPTIRADDRNDALCRPKTWVTQSRTSCLTQRPLSVNSCHCCFHRRL